MQNVAQNTLDLIPKISSFYQRNSIQDLMDAFIAKYKTDITTFTFKLTAPGAAQATPTEAENIFAEAKADLVQSGIPENADKELPKPDEEEKKEQWAIPFTCSRIRGFPPPEPSGPPWHAALYAAF